jgi:pyruvate carboxylase
MAIFMVQNGLTPENIYEKAKDIDFPDSVVSYFEGMMGQPEGGFPEKLQKLVLKGKPAITVRPGTLLPDEDFDAIRRNLEEAYGPEIDDRDVLSYALYPKVYEDYRAALEADGDLSLMGSDVFFHGLWEGETANVKIEEGKELVVRLIEVRSVDEEGNREVVFEINGNRRGVTIKDNRVTGVVHKSSTTMADPNDPGQIGANMPGIVIRLFKKEGDSIAEGEPIGVLEAMKMETNILSPVSGQIEKLLVEEGSTVVTGELLAVVLS